MTEQMSEIGSTRSVRSRLQAAKSRTFPTAARVYTDLVKRRTRVQVVERKDYDDDELELVFIIGCFRSGTTLLRYLLDSHSEIASPGETEFLLPLCTLLEDSRQSEALEYMGFDREAVAGWLRRSSRQLYSNYGAAKNAKIVVDKTPGYAAIAPQLYEIHPDARFVGIHRHPLDQIASFTRGLTYAPPEIDGLDSKSSEATIACSAADFWNSTVERMDEIKNLSEGQWCEVRYEDLCTETELETRRVCDHLGVEYEDGMLQYWEHSHDLGLEGGKALGFRDIQTRSGAWSAWDPKVIEQILIRTESGRSLVGYAETPPV